MKLRPYQELAVKFLQNTPRAGLFLDMSLGKTAITLSALEPHHLPALVVAPKRVAERVWPKERSLWRPDLSLSLAAGSPAERQAAFAARADLTVVSRDHVGEARPGYRTIILDESSSFRDKTTKRWRAVRKPCLQADQVWLLTGTPTPNTLLGLWAQMYLLDKGERLGTTLTGYRNRYFYAAASLPSGVVTSWLPREHAAENIHKKVEDICLYMSSDDELDLPPTRFNVVDIELPATVRRNYKEFKDTLVLDLEILGEEIYSAANAAVLSNKLRQVTSGFIFSDEKDGSFTRLHTAKLDALQEIVDGAGDNLLVFYNYKPELQMIREKFPLAKMLDEPGAQDEWDRAELPMMLAHPASAAHGLNLQFGGHTAVWYSLTWDLELYLQANRRLNRPGQQHPVVIHSLECDGTVDKLVAKSLADKEFDQSSFLDHVRNPL